MIDFDLKYNNHNLIRSTNYTSKKLVHFICTNCDVICYGFLDGSRGNKLYCSEINKKYIPLSKFEYFTCEEWIIKNILE